MKQIVYLIRHSKSFQPNNNFNNEPLQLQNEKYPLSMEGEEIARKKLVNDELTNLDIILSSSYVRAISTAKYLTINNNKEIVISPNFGERKFGIKSYNEIPNDFYLRQWEDENYKLGDGECLKEVRKRCYDELNNLLNRNYKRIAIVSHSTAMGVLLRTWCKVSSNNENMIEIKFKDKIIKIDKIDNCMIFKLEFNGRKLNSIKLIENNY